METHILRAGSNDAGKRIDRILRAYFPGAGLGALFAALRRGDIRANGKKVLPDYRVGEGDAITVKKISPFFSAEKPAPAAHNGAAESFIQPLILFENDDLLALNKPWGMLCHGRLSLDEYVKACLTPKMPPSLAFAPAPLHRLDRNTTGLIFFSKSIEGARAFTGALRSGKTIKKYYALLEGRIDSPAVWTDNLERDTHSHVTRAAASPETGKAALTEIRPLAAAGCTLCEIIIRTGRTHQIRAQAAARGHPLAGDRKYGGQPLRNAPHDGAYILHAAELSLRPGGGAPFKALTVKAPLPEDVREFLGKLFHTRNLLW